MVSPTQEQLLANPLAVDVARLPAAGSDLLDHILAAKLINSVYQPIVDLDSNVVVAFEALARGPRGSALERPDLLFAAARRARRLADLDRACRTAALVGAEAGGLTDPWTVFVNIEAETARGTFQGSPDLDRSESLPDHGGASRLRVVVELTERALTTDPTQLLQVVARIRARGWGIALDDVGADRDSLALLPLLRPDVIKLDLRLIQDRPTADIAEIVSAVNAEAERSGTAILAEGIETEEHLAVALGLGASLGQGWLLGRPGPLPEVLPPLTRPRIVISDRGDQVPAQSPFELGAARLTTRTTRKSLLIEISKHLERQAMRSGEATVLLATFQDHQFFTTSTRRRYAELARTAAFVGALGEGMPDEPLPGVRGGVLTLTDPVIGEWDIAVVGPHFAAVLVARDLGDDGPDAQRRFEFVLSHDRELAIAVASSLFTRIAARRDVTDLPTLPVPGDATSPAPAAPASGPAAAASVFQAMPGLLHRALDATRTGIAIADAAAPGMPLIYVNPGFQAITGYTEAQALGQNCRFLQGPGTDPRSVAEMSQALGRAQTLRTRVRNYRADGTPFWNQLELHPVLDHTGALTHYISVQDDITARVEAEDRIAHLAYHDQLTSLPNRALFADALHRALDRGRRTHTATALLFIDLDDFKLVNDRHGHLVGDAVLQRVAGRLREATRTTDVLARHGGDEFLLLLTDLESGGAGDVTDRVVRQIHTALASPLDLSDLIPGDNAHLVIAATVGTCVTSSAATTAQDMIRQADHDMYSRKNQPSRRP